MILPLSPGSSTQRADANDAANGETLSEHTFKPECADRPASAAVIVEPYERYKSIELRAECYRRGTRPIRTGARANDNKAGYLSLLRAHDKTNASSCVSATSADNRASLELLESPTATKRVLSSVGVDSSDVDPAATGAGAAAVAPAPDNGEAQDNAVKRRRTRGRAYVPGETSKERETAQSFFRLAPDAASARAQGVEEKQFALEYMRLKMELLRETHAMEKARRCDDKRLKLHTELQGVVTTLAQLHRLAKEYELERNAELLNDATQDIAFFQTRKRQIKQELLNDACEEQQQRGP